MGQGNREISRDTVAEAKVLFIGGANTSSVAKTLGISWQSAKNLVIRFKPLICKCGKKISHKGRCIPSFEIVSETLRPGSFGLSESNFTSIIPDGSIGRCLGDLACPYPVVENCRCRQHAIDSRLSFSFLSSTLEPEHIFSFPQRNRTPRRSGCK